MQNAACIPPNDYQDQQHPLAKRFTPPMITRGIGSGSRQRPWTLTQCLGTLISPIPRPILTPPHYLPGSTANPT
ncbi:hypothetical protein N7495_009581 [Penicillium taxi]|uniref:uncharacterized protein n=1 Tax=Penicillium taxi TaxID=168475 RepID=UPI00254535ED|nr:uncharacterized protein N7495_009581 [Penicillium taxi]KAJ5885071.1 hypothetical protein N7495_009581 [Penicillium taxi]